MCFSAPASFLAAGVTGIIGIGCLAKVRRARELPLAAMPVLFALQQFAEGLLWMTLPVAPDAARASLLTFLFLIYAKVLWPIYVPVASALVEPDQRRQAIMWLIGIGGAATGAFFLQRIWRDDHTASILGGHIVYEGPAELPLVVGALYFLATCLAPLLSSHRAIRVLALIVLAGAAITYAFYWQAFTSVWCFFAAAASIVLYHHFARTLAEPSAVQVRS